MFFRCNANNHAGTVLYAFQNAVVTHGLASRIRGDPSTKNFDVRWYMLTHPQRGPDRCSFIAAKSCHNKRIERL